MGNESSWEEGLEKAKATERAPSAVWAPDSCVPASGPWDETAYGDGVFEERIKVKRGPSGGP